MPHYEWTGDGVYRDRRNDREVAPGDVVELTEHVAEPVAALRRVEHGEADADAPQPDDDSEFDVEAFLDRTPVSDVAEDIERGAADDRLDDVKAAASRKTVETAVEDRYQELEG
jgi:hypothetical protein